MPEEDESVRTKFSLFLVSVCHFLHIVLGLFLFEKLPPVSGQINTYYCTECTEWLRLDVSQSAFFTWTDIKD